MALFDSHPKCARCRKKGLDADPCIEKKVREIFVGPTDVNVLGQVER